MDFGVDALCLPKDAPRLLAPRVRAPILLPAYLDAWASTSPAPAADPDVATFLHGPEAGPGDVEVVWRADLAEDDLGDSALAAALVGVIPPSSLEAVAVPVFVARAWLQHRSVQVADVEGAGLPADSDRDHTTRSALRWRGPDDPETRVVRAEEIRAGDLIVAPAAYGGCDQFGGHILRR